MTSRQTNRRSLRLAILLLSGSAIAGVPLVAFADSAWLGGTSTDWFTTGNWSPTAVPTSADDVLIDLNANAPFITGAAASANVLTIGQSNTGQLTVDTGGSLGVNRIELGQNAGSSGTLTVQAGAPLTDAGSLAIGDSGNGTMSVLGGATVTAGITSLGFSTGSTGSLLIDGMNSHMTVDLFTVGENGIGTMTISNGGLLTGQNDAAIGFFQGLTPTTSTATVTDSSSEWDLGSHTLTIGVSSHSSGSLTVSNNALLNAGRVEIAQDSQSTGTLTVDSGATLTDAGSLAIGDFGVGTMNVQSGATVTSGITSLGFSPGSSGTLLIDGVNSHMTVDLFTVGENGAGTLTVSNGGLLTGQNDAAIGFFQGLTPTASTATVTGAGSEWDLGAHTLTVGVSSHSSGALTLSAGALLNAGRVEIGQDSQSTGTITVDGTNSQLLSMGDIVIGDAGVGTLNITNGGFAAGAPDISLGVQAGSSGTINLSGFNSGFGTSGTVHIGVAGNGAINVSDDAALGAQDITLGEDASSSGSISVGNNGAVAVIGTVRVGDNGTGSVTILSTGGNFNAGNIDLGVNAGSHGTMALLANSGITSGSTVGNLTVGDAGTGTLAIGAGGLMLVQSAVVGSQSGGNGTMTVDGSGAQLSSNTGGLVVGQNSGAVGTVTFSNMGLGGVGATTELGVSSGATGTLTVTDTGSRYETFDNLYVGEGGTGTLNVQNGGFVLASARTYIGDNPGATGILSIDGAGSTFTADDVILVGGDAVNAAGGNGTVRVTNGGTLAGSGIYLAVLPGSTGTMLVDGVGSTVSGALVSVGYGATGNATVQNGGVVTANIVDIAGIPNSTGTLTIDGAGSSVSANVTGAIGDFGNGTLIVRNGGAYSAGQAFIGYEAAGGFTGVGTATVDGVGSTFTAQSLDVGLAGHGALIVANGGVATVTGALRIATLAGSVGEIDIGAAPGSAPVAPGSIAASSITFGAGTGSVNFNSTGVTFNTVISGAGTINQIAGDTILPGDESAFTGAANITGGALHVNGSLRSSAVTVSGGGTLNGNGTVGSVSAASGGIVAPGNSIGTLTVNGDYNAASGSVYQAQLDSGGHADLLTVTGTATLANGAILNVTKTDAGSYAPGTYTLLTAAGGINGTYTVTGDIIQSSAFTSQKVSYDSHDVYLNVSKVASFASAGITPNQIAVGGGADSLPTTSPLYGALISLPTFAVAQGAFDQLSGEIHASAKTAELEDSRLPREAALGRLSMAFAAGDAGSKHPAPWGQVYGSWGSTDANGNAAALGRSSRGFLGGFDLPVYEMWRVGILGGYSRGSFNVKDRSSFGTSDSYHLGGYAGLQDGALGVRFGMVYSWHDLTTGRTVNFAGFNNALASEYNAGTTQGFGEVDYHVPVAQIDLEPFANLAYVSLHTDVFSETGGTAALTAGGDTENAVFTTLGLRGKYDITLGNALIGTHGTVGWRHAFGDLTPNTAMSFTGSNAFTIQGVPLAQDGAAFGAGFDLSVAKNVLLGVSYDGQYAASAHDDTIKLNIDWKL